MLTHRPLTSGEAALLHEELKTTPNIIGYTAKKLLRFRDVWVADEDGVFAGVCISKDLRWNWTDIAVLYVLPGFRGRGLARSLYTEAWRRAEGRRRHVYTLSCSASVIHLMREFGMECGPAWRAPLAVHLHMNRHMMSVYRWRESARKGRNMKREAALVSGTCRRKEKAHLP